METQPAVIASTDRRVDFICNNTMTRPVPLCPEIVIRVADEAFPLWEKTEEDLGEMGLPPPFWAFAWAGGQALARYVLDHPETVRGKVVLDLGSGSGLVAIAAMMAGASAVTAADPDPWAGAAIGLNADLNGVSVTAIADDVLDRSGAGYEAVLVGDLFYDRPIASRVEGFLQRCSASGATVLIGDPGRSYLPKDGLEKITTYGVPTTRALEDAEIKQTAVWQLAVTA